MDADFWLQRWSDRLIGFHQQSVNVHLQRHWDALAVKPGESVFVPLCGKSLDMLWLAERAAVLGVELSEIAVRDFFRENGLAASESELDEFAVFDAGNVRLLCGDFFHLEPTALDRVQAVYDRAALIALPAAMRPGYVQQLDRLLPAGVRMLLVTMVYEQSQMNGPPFSVTAEEVQTLFSPGWAIQSLGVTDILAREDKFRERGLTRLEEQLYLLCKQ